MESRCECALVSAFFGRWMTIASFFSGIGGAFKNGAYASASAAKGAASGLPFLLGGGLCRYSEFWEYILPCILAFWLGVVAVLILLACCACAAGGRWWWTHSASDGGRANRGAGRRTGTEPEVEVPPPTQVFHGGPVRAGLRKRGGGAAVLQGWGAAPPVARAAVVAQEKWKPVGGDLFNEGRPTGYQAEERPDGEDAWAAAARPRVGADW